MERVIVVGSINQDVTVTVDRFPDPGETLSGRDVTYGLGGKGANQAAAAAHAGADVVFIGAVGGDPAGAVLRNELQGHGVNISRLTTRTDVATGTAFITVTTEGENTIILSAGANELDSEYVAHALDDLRSNDVVVLQGEIPAHVNELTIRRAQNAGAQCILNLAPASPVTSDILSTISVLIVNETEAGLVLEQPAPTNIEQALAAAHALRAVGAPSVIITLGKEGAVWAHADESGHVPSISLGPVVDTTGAGDATVGVFAAALAHKFPFLDALNEGMRAGSTAVLRPGAAASYIGIHPTHSAHSLRQKED